VFNTPQAQVSYEQVLQFCQTYPEGVRVEYKREMTNIPKVISCFANTVGGIWIIGVDTDKKTNRTILPPTGMKHVPGIEEQITQSVHAGVYPAITPAVRVFEIPNAPGQVLAVVKIAESVEAPHAIENSTRVWIRNASTTEPYNLADIGRIEYLLRRRREGEERRERLVLQMAERSPFTRTRRVRVVVAPIYLSGTLLSNDELYRRAKALETQHAYLRDFRTVHEGVMSSEAHHFEVSVHGIAFFEKAADIAGALDGIQFVLPINLIYPVGRVLKTALLLLNGEITNVLVRYELIGWKGVGFLKLEPARLRMPQMTLQHRQSVNEHVSVFEHMTTDAPPAQRVAVLTRLLRGVMWAFNYPPEDMTGIVQEIVDRNNLI